MPCQQCNNDSRRFRILKIDFVEYCVAENGGQITSFGLCLEGNEIRVQSQCKVKTEDCSIARSHAEESIPEVID